MKALSIRQPWAWLILNAGKDIENRVWPTNVRGRFWIHAGKGMTKDEYENAYITYQDIVGMSALLPPFRALERGGIVGSVGLIDCVADSDSEWFFGEFGFVLRDPKPITFVPYKGQLGFFEVPLSVTGSDPFRLASSSTGAA